MDHLRSDSVSLMISLPAEAGVPTFLPQMNASILSMLIIKHLLHRRAARFGKEIKKAFLLIQYGCNEHQRVQRYLSFLLKSAQRG